MEKQMLKQRLWAGLAWSGGIAVAAGGIMALLNLLYSAWSGYLQASGVLALGGTILVVLSTALFTFPLALLIFWGRAYYRYVQKKKQKP